MSLDKAILSGKEKRRPYRGAKAADCTCRNHGSCPHCLANRLHSDRKRELAAEGQLDEWAEQEAEESVEEVCWEAWSDFLAALEEGRGAEWLNLDPTNDDDELPLFMLERFEEMRREYHELQDKLQRQKERNEALTTELYSYRKRAALEKKLAEAAKP